MGLRNTDVRRTLRFFKRFFCDFDLGFFGGGGGDMTHSSLSVMSSEDVDATTVVATLFDVCRRDFVRMLRFLTIRFFFTPAGFMLLREQLFVVVVVVVGFTPAPSERCLQLSDIRIVVEKAIKSRRSTFIDEPHFISVFVHLPL